MSFGTKQATEKIKEGNFISKRILPGNNRCKLNGIYTKEVEDKKKGGTRLQLWLTLEGEPMGGDFKGWAIDKEDESKGFSLGQIGNVKSNPFGYKTETNAGVTYNREASIATFLHILCLEANGSRWIEEADGRYKTFEDFIKAFNEQNPIKDVFLDYCIGGSKSINAEGYADYWLNLPKTAKGERVFKNPTKNGQLVKFDEVLHIYDNTNKSDVDGFGQTGSAPIASTQPPKNWDAEDTEDIDFTPVATTEEDPFAVDETTADIDPFDVD